MVNSVVLVGRLTRDPELRYTPNGAPVTRFDLAVDRRFKGPNGEKQTDFIRISCWNKQAEFAANYLQKGSLIGVEGSLRIDTVTQQDGTRRSYTEVRCEHISFVGARRDSATPQEENEFADFGEVVEAPRLNEPKDQDEEDDIPFA
ncbi:MAG: single-stranded DNA-binding protein [Symbiobacteriaceae bacterium]|nr:single-stranded DNA-binding protein [Symbiobacteriaceae bacterium]